MKKNVKKLGLGRETVRTLHSNQLDAVVGGLTTKTQDGVCPGSAGVCTVSNQAHGCETTRTGC